MAQVLFLQPRLEVVTLRRLPLCGMDLIFRIPCWDKMICPYFPPCCLIKWKLNMGGQPHCGAQMQLVAVFISTIKPFFRRVSVLQCKQAAEVLDEKTLVAVLLLAEKNLRVQAKYFLMPRATISNS